MGEDRPKCETNPSCDLVIEVHKMAEKSDKKEMKAEKERNCYRDKFNKMFDIVRSLERGLRGDRENNLEGTIEKVERVEISVVSIEKHFADIKDDIKFIRRLRSTFGKVTIAFIPLLLFGFMAWQLHVFKTLAPTIDKLSNIEQKVDNYIKLDMENKMKGGNDNGDG